MNELIEKYGTIGAVVFGEQKFPILNIHMMSDERWKKITAESAVKHFCEWFGREPETLQEAFEGQRTYIEKLLE